MRSKAHAGKVGAGVLSRIAGKQMRRDCAQCNFHTATCLVEASSCRKNHRQSHQQTVWDSRRRCKRRCAVWSWERARTTKHAESRTQISWSTLLCNCCSWSAPTGFNLRALSAQLAAPVPPEPTNEITFNARGSLQQLRQTSKPAPAARRPAAPAPGWPVAARLS